MDRTKLMPGRIMVLLVCSGAVLDFEYLRTISEICRSGSERTAPWFGNVLWNGVKEAVEKNWVSGNLYGWF